MNAKPQYEVPPQEKQWFLVLHEPGAPLHMEIHKGQYMLGFGGIYHKGGGYFAAQGTLEGGPSGDKTGWLCVGRDARGDLWLWFQDKKPVK